MTTKVTIDCSDGFPVRVVNIDAGTKAEMSTSYVEVGSSETFLVHNTLGLEIYETTQSEINKLKSPEIQP